MNPLERMFAGNIWVVNLKRRPDRLLHFQTEMAKAGIDDWQRFEAVDAGKDFGNHGCCASHKAVLDLIAKSGKPGFVFEDDASLRDQFRDSFASDVVAPLRELPADWDIIYLGGGYADDPQGWHSKHLIRINGMKTTSSYGITPKAARELSDYIPDGCSSDIDDIFSGYTVTHNCFISEPRFFIQYENYSDLQKAVLNNGLSMEDLGHTTRLGKYRPV